MVSKKLILWSNIIIAIATIVLSIIVPLYIHHKIGDIWLYGVGLLVIIILFITLHNSIFTFDEAIFLNAYDSIKAKEKELADKIEIVSQHIVIIGQHEAMKLWNIAQSPIVDEEKLKIGYDKLVSEIGATVKNTIQSVEKIPEEIKAETKKIFEKTPEPTTPTTTKEIFEEKAANNIQIPTSIADSNPELKVPDQL